MNQIWLNAVRASSAAMGNWWDMLTNVVAVYQPIGAASLAASYVNLANPGTFDAAPGVAPTHSALTGWGFNGIDQYLTTGIVPQQPYSMFVRFSKADLAEGNVAGVFSPDRRFFIFPRRSGNLVRYGIGSSLIDVAPQLSAGVLAISELFGYRNGVVDTAMAGAWVGAGTQQIFLGCQNTDGTPSNFFPGNIQTVAICSSTQTPQQMADVSAAMAAL